MRRASTGRPLRLMCLAPVAPLVPVVPRSCFALRRGLDGAAIEDDSPRLRHAPLRPPRRSCAILSKTPASSPTRIC